MPFDLAPNDTITLEDRMGRPRKETDIVATFRSARVLTLDDIGHRLSISRSTVLRRLAEHGYVSS